jgi:uncharacterized protein
MKSKIPVISAELFVIPIEDNRYLLYAPLRKAAFVGNAGTVNFIADLQEGVYREDNSGDSTVEFLRRLEILDAGEETPPLHSCEGVPAPTDVSLLLTTACNLRCSYCYASAGDTRRESMPLEVALRGIDFVISNAVGQQKNIVEINYPGGGEPSLNWRTLAGSLKYARRKAEKHGVQIMASMATNGMFADSRIDWITANLQGVSLSFDGLPEAQDKHRVLPSGQGSSERVIRTLRRFDEAGFNYGIRMTATADLIPSMPDSVEYICSTFKPAAIQVEPAFRIGRYADRTPTETEEFIAAFREARRRAAKYGKELTYSGARINVLTNHFCAATQDSFALLPDGTVSSCFEAFSRTSPWGHIFFYGSPDEGADGYRFDMERVALLRSRAVQNREHCRGCFAKWTCAGDCLYKTLTVNSEGEFTDTTRCHINRELTKDLILSRIAEAGGLCWHELPENLSEQAYRDIENQSMQNEHH